MVTKRLAWFYKILFMSAALMALFVSYVVSHRHSFPVDTRPHFYNNTYYLGQGWQEEQRQKFSYISFGSRIIPYDWFLALEQADSKELFREPSHLRRLGFIQEAGSRYNPDGLPVGFSRDLDQKKVAWVGFTCAACHTGELTIQGQSVRIDGGQALIDFTAFEHELSAALKTTLNQSDKWRRFTERLTASKGKLDLAELKKSFESRSQYFEKRIAMNATEVNYGFGRLDAFGQIFNAVAVEALHLPENSRSPNAPTSYPFLWNAPHLDLVQWNASAPNKEPGPLFQNITTALAVYGEVTVEADKKTYTSSVEISNLGYIQSSLYALRSPKWPENLAGSLNKELILEGEKIYQAECVACHQLVNENIKNYQLSAVVVPIETVGTDPVMAKNFSEGKVKTGMLQGKKSFVLAGKPFGTEASRLDEVMHVAVGAALNRPLSTLGSITEEFQFQKASAPNSNPNVYKARPLAGIWAAAPYLHNGSVPTVYDLLLPPEQRPMQFYVGNRELDTQKLGYQYSESEGASLFDTQLPGNSNAGHLYGTQLAEQDRLALLEYLKSL